MTKTTIKKWIALRKKYLKARSDFRKYDTKLKSMPEGQYIFDSLRLNVYVQEYRTFDKARTEKAGLEVITKKVSRKVLKVT